MSRPEREGRSELEGLWTELRDALGMKPGAPGARSFWDDLMGDGAGGGMFFDAEGNDRTQLVKALMARVDTLDQTVAVLADRVAVLERIVVTDEKRLSEEIERLRGGTKGTN
jgi:hypothetical protein